jgi:hypothetical protein
MKDPDSQISTLSIDFPPSLILIFCKGMAGSRGDVSQVMSMCNPKDNVIDQGADPLSAPQLLILHWVVCALEVQYVCSDNDVI